MLTVLLQGADENVRALLDTPHYMQLVAEAGCHAYLIEDGAITDLTETAYVREPRAS